MRVYPEKLASHLKQSGLPPVCVIAGDEPLLVAEAQDAVRSQARSEGYSGREVFDVTRYFDWDELMSGFDSLSLFAEKRVFDVRMPTGKPGDAGGKALRAFAESPPPDTLLLLTSGKIDASTQKTRWFKELTAAGVFVPIYPVKPKELPRWLLQRMKAKGLIPDADAVELLAERIEGNLLAGAQEIEKLSLLHGKGPVSVAQVIEGVADSARFDVFACVDAALDGDAARVVRMSEGLKTEGVASVLVLWAYTRDVRALLIASEAARRGKSPSAALTEAGVWKQRMTLLGGALQRLRLPLLRRLMVECGRIDRICKGQAPGNDWDELVQLGLQMAGAMAPMPRIFSVN